MDRVLLNSEFTRIRDLPRRVWQNDVESLADEMSEILRTDGGSMSLRTVQAAALFEIGTVGGLFGPLRVGAGKTLITLLAPVVCDADRALLLVPAGLVDKTRRDEAELAKHWRIGEIEIMSYEWLGRAQAADALEERAPDLIIADEAHRLKNPKAAVTRRVRRYMRAHPDTKFVAMSGTITKRSIKDYAHLLTWTHADPPIPTTYRDLELWSGALDELRGPHVFRADPGALVHLCDEFERAIFHRTPRHGARLGFRRRLTETPGVVATDETPIDASITVRSVEPPPSPAIDEVFHTLRDVWETPDGWPIADHLALFRHARELALGFYYAWDPRPPAYWLDARREWAAYVREVLARSRSLDSELQVRNAHATAPECVAWLDVQKDFKPNTVPRWIDESVVEFCAGFDGIVWTEHMHFAERLAAVSGLPYYGRKGRNEQGQAIEDHAPGEPMIASIASNATGRNLQAWCSNLIASVPSSGAQVEQLFGRTHRDGQTADEVRFDVLMNCAEHLGAFGQAVNDAKYILASTGSPQKLLLADLDVLTVNTPRNGARWNK